MSRLLSYHCCILLVFLLFTACNKNKEASMQMLNRAQEAYQNENYLSAKTLLDSLKLKYPKEMETLKDGFRLRRQVELGEQERNSQYYDSMMIVKRAEADSMKKLFVFEKNPQYDETGKYIDKQQVLERNINRTYLRSGVDEQGKMYIASVYFGSRPIHHKQLKVSTQSGEYSETLIIPEDGGTNFSFKDLGNTTEVVTYQSGKDNGVIQFIYEKRNTPLKVELIGNSTVRFALGEGDKKALVKAYELSIVLSDIERLKFEINKANARIAYLKSKIDSIRP